MGAGGGEGLRPEAAQRINRQRQIVDPAGELLPAERRGLGVGERGLYRAKDHEIKTECCSLGELRVTVARGRDDWQSWPCAEGHQADRDRDAGSGRGAPVKQLDWDSFKSLYNGGSLRTTGVKTSGNETYDP